MASPAGLQSINSVSTFDLKSISTQASSAVATLATLVTTAFKNHKVVMAYTAATISVAIITVIWIRRRDQEFMNKIAEITSEIASLKTGQANLQDGITTINAAQTTQVTLLQQVNQLTEELVKIENRLPQSSTSSTGSTSVPGEAKESSQPDSEAFKQLKVLEQSIDNLQQQLTALKGDLVNQEKLLKKEITVVSQDQEVRDKALKEDQTSLAQDVRVLKEQVNSLEKQLTEIPPTASSSGSILAPSVSGSKRADDDAPESDEHDARSASYTELPGGLASTSVPASTATIASTASSSSSSTAALDVPSVVSSGSATSKQSSVVVPPAPKRDYIDELPASDDPDADFTIDIEKIYQDLKAAMDPKTKDDLNKNIQELEKLNAELALIPEPAVLGENDILGEEPPAPPEETQTTESSATTADDASNAPNAPPPPPAPGSVPAETIAPKKRSVEPNAERRKQIQDQIFQVEAQSLSLIMGTLRKTEVNADKPKVEPTGLAKALLNKFRNVNVHSPIHSESEKDEWFEES